MRIGLITSTKFKDLYEDDRLFADELKRRGHSVAPIIWTEPGDLNAHDVIVMRSPWDWFHHRKQFREFLKSLASTKARVINSPAQLMEFADKTYLPKLQAKGVAVVPTEQLAYEDLPRVPELVAKHGWSKAVLKPAFTANAVGAHLFDAPYARAVLTELIAPLESAPWLLQPFIPTIAEGELSFIFFGGVFSHAVRKKPKSNEWRVQHEYGGESAPYDASAKEIAEATEILQKAAPGTTYARVDGVIWNGRLHLMELELVEPELFFRHAPKSPALFADALGLKRISQGVSWG